MHAATFEAVFIEQLAQCRRRVTLENIGRAGITPKLDGLITELGQFFECPWHIPRKLTVNSVELKANRNVSGLIGLLGLCLAQGHTQRATETRANELASINWELHKIFLP